MRPLLLAASILFGVAPVGLAQSPSSGSAASGQADSSKPAPACAKSDSTAKSKAATQAAPDANKKPRKIWTNEAMGSVKGDVSVVGGHQAPIGSDEPSPAPRTPAYDQLVQTYRNKLTPLRNDVADYDLKIQQAKEAKGNAREDTAAWIAVQQKRRGEVLAKIERIQEEARKQGIQPGDLRD